MKDLNEFIEKNKLNRTQSNILKSMVLTGSTKEKALKAISGYKVKIETNHHKKKGNRCPRCSMIMSIVSLVDGRKAKYCDSERICLPLPQTNKS